MNNNSDTEKSTAEKATHGSGQPVKNKVSTQPVLTSNRQSGNQDGATTNQVSNWATTVSQYILKRRQQTQLAYQAQLQPNTLYVEGNDTQDWLFEAVFELLVQRLEEGHTVLVLEGNHSNTDMYDSNDVREGNGEIFAWQQQLLQPLLQPLLILLEGAPESATATELLEQKALWDMVMRQSTLPEYDQQVLEQRYRVCVHLHNYLKRIVVNSNLITNSLRIFINDLSIHPLFEEDRHNSKCKISRPIIFHSENPLDSSDTTITLWLHRTWQAEHALAGHIVRIKEQKVTELTIPVNPALNTEQQDAILMANKSAFSIITGGPGTGKTFTIAQLVIALQQAQFNEAGVGNTTSANLALAAPTGKAAQRMQESLQDAIQRAGVSMQLPEAKTIHRLLGIGQGGRPRYNDKNPLSEDIIIIDEASMLGVELANYLVGAIKPNARLILLGDANQLAAVDAGAVLADLCRIPALQDVHKQLEMSRRFTADSGIGTLARLINQGGLQQRTDKTNIAEVWELLKNDQALEFYHLTNVISDNVDNTNMASNDTITKNSLSNYKFLNELLIHYFQFITGTKKILKNRDNEKSTPIQESINNFKNLMILLNQFRILTAGHHGHCGDHYINRYLSEQHRGQLKLPLSKSPWYHGRPVMVLQNNYELGLFNGDIGICLQTERGHLQVFFENKKQGMATNMLNEEMIATAYAMTIHKSQGSEFDHVAIAFDDRNGRLLSQELIYTAVTRAKKQVSIFSTASAFTRALSTPTQRQTGLGLQFSALDDIS